MLLQSLILVIQLVLLAGVTAFLVWQLMMLISNYLDAPIVPTPGAYAPLIGQSLDVRPGSHVYDLGSGDGRLLFALARLYPNARFIGIERNPLLAWYSYLYSQITRQQNVEIRRENIFSTDLSGATHLYAYLTPAAIEKRFAETSTLSGIRLASRAFPVTRLTPEKVVELSKEAGAWNQHLLYVYSL